MTGVCFCLAAPAAFGFAPSKTASTVWACTPKHAAIAQKFYGRERNLMGENEMKARAAAGKAAGLYLDKLGVTDMAALSKEQWDIFLQAVIETYRDEMTKLCEPF